MPEKILPIFYSDKSLADSVAIKNFILLKFTVQVVNNFYRLLGNFERIVAAFPELYPKSIKSRNIRRAVLSKQLSVFYKVTEDKIAVAAILDNRMDYDKWP